MKVLHIDSSILMENSVSRALSSRVVERILETHPEAQVTRLDLASDDIAHLTAADLGRLAEGQDGDYVEQFLGSDIVIIGTGLYNWNIPSQLKAWMDRIVVAGRTFRYTPEGAVGLAGGRRLIITIARGGFYGENSPVRHLEHGETYLTGVFNLLGLDAIDVITADGIGVSFEARQAAIKSALAAIDKLDFA